MKMFDKKELGFGAEVFKKQTNLNSEQFVTLQLIDQTSQTIEVTGPVSQDSPVDNTVPNNTP